MKQLEKRKEETKSQLDKLDEEVGLFLCKSQFLCPLRMGKPGIWGALNTYTLPDASVRLEQLCIQCFRKENTKDFWRKYKQNVKKKRKRLNF